MSKCKVRDGTDVGLILAATSQPNPRHLIHPRVEGIRVVCGAVTLLAGMIGSLAQIAWSEHVLPEQPICTGPRALELRWMI